MRVRSLHREREREIWGRYLERERIRYYEFEALRERYYGLRG